MDTKLIALPSDPHGSLACWVHWDCNSFPGGHSITREHMKAWEVFTMDTELTEEQAREYDPKMFNECLDRPYADHPSMLQFYIARAQECVDFEPAADQVEQHLVKDLGYEIGGPVCPAISIMAIALGKMQDFGVIAYNKSNTYIIDKDTVKYVADSRQLRKWIASDKTHLSWWRYNTLEKNLTPEVFNERMRNL
jgi:hypothetical protein